MPVNYSQELNKSQQEAVFYDDGPALIIAGAGAGKTRVLIYKIGYLLSQGVQPWNILALTFTNKAAAEMKQRIARQVGDSAARGLWMGTFHSIFSRVLRNEAQLLGYDANYTIYDQADSRSLVKSIVKEMQLDDKVYKPNQIQDRISQAKNRLVSPQEYAASAAARNSDQAHRIPAFSDIYRRYCDRCRQSNAMDFDDLLVNTHRLFRDHPDVCDRYATQFTHVLVDEYQDTNYAQHCIVWQLTQKNRHVCVVGDDAQSIYSFRGADIDNILKFTTQYKGARLFKLEQNYRSTRMIVNAANSLIAKNSEQIPKEVYSTREQGEPVGLMQAYSDVEEGEAVANKIELLRRKEGLDYNQFAILYRTNAQSRIFEEALRKRSVPYRIYGGLSFYQRKEIKDVIAYFRLAVNPNDGEALRRVINYPARGIGDTTMMRIAECATLNETSLWQVVSHPDEWQLPVSRGIATRLADFAALVSDFARQADTQDAYTLGRTIVRQSGIAADIYRDTGADDIARQQNVEELLNAISDFCSTRHEEGSTACLMNDFLSQVSLLSDQDRDSSGSEERVTLMTMHAAKGLEYQAVFVVGMEENLMPSPMCCNSPRALEEERRLLYVAITRAERFCYLSFAKSRYHFGHFEFCEPSRFLQDIDTRYLRMPAGVRPATLGSDTIGQPARFALRRPLAAAGAGEQRRSPAPTPAPPPPAAPRNLRRVDYATLGTSSAAQGTQQLAVGQMIEHERFGVGVVKSVEGSGDNAKASIEFRNVGTKLLLLKFARFKVIS